MSLLPDWEGNSFSTTGNLRDDILSITAVYPMREDAVMELLNKTGSKYELLNRLIEENLIGKLQYRGSNYYMRKFRR